MTIKTLATQIAKLEGKKSQARIGDIREILSILSDLIVSDPTDVVIYDCLFSNGQKRLKKFGINIAQPTKRRVKKRRVKK